MTNTQLGLDALDNELNRSLGGYTATLTLIELTRDEFAEAVESCDMYIAHPWEDTRYIIEDVENNALFEVHLTADGVLSYVDKDSPANSERFVDELLSC